MVEEVPGVRRLDGCRTASLVLLGASLASAIGCSTVMALKRPGPVPDECVSLGMNRDIVEDFLPQARRTDPTPDSEGRLYQYRYQDGPPHGTKIRILLYLAGDVVTFFLAELAFIPIEVFGSARVERLATAEFDAEDRLVHWQVERARGHRVLRTLSGSDTGEAPAADAPSPEADSFNASDPDAEDPCTYTRLHARFDVP